ncbi:MAG TPA: hypothetical protein VNG13_05380 [Mycobacteriales bacterium]|nr:hypothetical protein [Mycobacteriales bacterium]
MTTAVRNPKLASVPRPRPPLRLVPTAPTPQAGQRPGRLAFVLLVVGLLGAGLVGLLLLNTLSAQDAFRIQDLQLRAGQLADAEQALAGQVDTASAPDALAAAAQRLGMDPGGAPIWVRLRDGQMLGEIVAAPAPPAVIKSAPAKAAPVTKAPRAAAKPAVRKAPRKSAHR